ncbi:MAG: aminoacyl-tRNA hydrolase [Oscillospiraceae bacterium]|nr:aminoacyl-tRNA hydrolase [Oscillospiraceae bacterium]
MFFKGQNEKSAYDFAIVGLGNPGAKYEGTRHNVGFNCADVIAKDHNAKLSKNKYNAFFGEINIAGKRCLIIKPQTFMNLSGEAVVPILKFYKIQSENTIIIFDDVSLDVGRLRLRRKGSDGGHNGMRNIIEQSGTDNFMRIKIGVGKKPHPDYDLADWVLSCFKGDDNAKITESIKTAAIAAECIVNNGIEDAMNKYNR